MVYTSNVPQANQQIATTQPLINANFGFIAASIGKEHNFDASNAANTYHTQASMPNQALSPSLPAGTNGMYFVSSGGSYFWDNTTNWKLNTWEGYLSGTFSPSSSSSYDNIAVVPASKVGIIILYRQSSSGYVQTGSWCSTTNHTFAYSNRIKINGSSDDYPVELNNNQSGSLNLQGRAFSGSYTGINYKYSIWYRPAS